MSLLKCPKCGEMFSDSYKECPFCLEDEDFYNGRKASRSGGRRVERPKAPSILGPAMLRWQCAYGKGTHPCDP